jgi:serine/threonine protein phosphatase PrpC
MKWHGIGQSDVGRRRSKNEDSFFVDDDLGLYIVSDGMGGHAAGEVASAEAVRVVLKSIQDGAADVTTHEAATALAERAVQTACRDIYKLARSDIRKAGMGCTLTVAWCRGNHVSIAHVGDSRCYLWRDGGASQVTADHTIGAELE